MIHPFYEKKYDPIFVKKPVMIISAAIGARTHRKIYT